MDLAQEIISGRSPAQLEYGIVIARKHVAAKDEAVVTFLKEIIRHCDIDPVGFQAQSLQARNELLQFYNKLGQAATQFQEFLKAIDAVNSCASTSAVGSWKKDHYKSFEVMEAALGLTASILKGGLDDDALKLFKRIEMKAEDSFGWDEERTIWAKITVGIIYQRHRSWNEAQEWFNHALAASVAANGDEDGISRSLHAALEKQHFSYLSDEGRPFKTIFGVSGLTIRPNRLHLD
jgi:tetratricopeptide (TPR) repeat protein